MQEVTVPEDDSSSLSSATSSTMSGAQQGLSLEERNKVKSMMKQFGGGKGEPHLKHVVKASSTKVHEVYGTLVRIAPFDEETDIPDACKVFLLDDKLVIGVETSQMNKHSKPRLGLVDRDGFQGSIEVRAARSSIIRTKKRHPLKLLFLLNMKQVHIKHADGKHFVQLRYVLRTKTVDAKGLKRLNTRIATIQVDFGSRTKCESFIFDFESRLALLDFGGNDPYASSKSLSRNGTRRNWSKRLSAVPVQRRRQVVSDNGSGKRVHGRYSAPQSSFASASPRHFHPKSSEASRRTSAHHALETLRRFSATHQQRALEL